MANTDVIEFDLRSMIIYAMTLVFALGFNDLFVSLFNSFSKGKGLKAKIIYVIVSLFVTALIVILWKKPPKPPVDEAQKAR